MSEESRKHADTVADGIINGINEVRRLIDDNIRDPKTRYAIRHLAMRILLGMRPDPLQLQDARGIHIYCREAIEK